MPTVKVELSAEIESAAERLWDLLADVKAWPEWQGTSYVDPPTGPLQKGSAFAAELGGHKWDVTVTEAERPNRLVWAGRQPGFRIIHEWEFLETGGKTQVISRDSMSGSMLVLMRAMLEKKVSEHDEKWLGNLKSKAESGPD